MTATLTLEQLQRLAPELQELISAHGEPSLRVFGSVVRGSAGTASDLDTLPPDPSRRAILCIHCPNGGNGSVSGSALFRSPQWITP